MIICEPRDDYPSIISELNYKDKLYNYVTGEEVGEYISYDPEYDIIHLYKTCTHGPCMDFNYQGIDTRYSYHHFGNPVENRHNLKFIITSIRLTNNPKSC
jgi:hypothetical protein